MAKKLNKGLKHFIKELKKRNGYVLDIVTVRSGDMIYYREYGDYATSSRTKVFYS